MRRRWKLAAAALLLAGVPASIAPACSAESAGDARGRTGGGERGRSMEVRVDPEIRAAIRDAVEAIVLEDEARMTRIARLEELASGRRTELLVQLALYLRDADGTEESMGGALLFHHLGFSTDEKLDALVPVLEAGDEPLRRTVRGLLGTIDRPDGGAPDFRPYEERLRHDRDEPPPGLIGYLFDVSPDAALEVLMRVHGPGVPAAPGSAAALEELRALDAAADRDGPLPRDQAKRARAAIDTLSRDPRWWVRRYAAALIDRDPALALPEVRSRLRSDPSPLVRD